MKFLFVAALCVAFAGIQALIGGTRLLYALPVYGFLGLIGLLLIPFYFRNRRMVGSKWCRILTFTLVAYGVARCLFSPVAYLAWPDLFMLLACLVVYCLTTTAIAGPVQRGLVIIFLAVTSVLHLWPGIQQFLRGEEYMLIHHFLRAPYNHRASGLFVCPNHYSGYLEMLTLMTLSLTIWGRMSSIWKVILGYLTLLGIVGIAISLSRGGYLSIGVGAVTFALISALAIWRSGSGKGWLATAIVLGTLVLVTGSAFLIYQNNDRIKQRAQNLIEMENVRFDLWDAGMKQFQLEPLAGTGAGTYLYYGRQFRHPRIQHDPIHVHNDYIHLLAEFGIIGAVIMLLFIGVHIGNGLKAIQGMIQERLLFVLRSTSSSFALTVGALSGLAALLAHSVVDFNMHIPANALLMAFLLGILAHPLEKSGSPDVLSKSSNMPGWIPRWVAAACGLVLLVSAILLTPSEYWTEEARVAVREKDWNRALDCIAKATKSEPANPFVYYYAGQTWSGLASGVPPGPLREAVLEKAASAYQQSLQRFPQNSTALLRQGVTLDQLGKFEEAGKVYAQALLWDPKLGRAHALYAQHLALQGKMEEAREHLELAGQKGGGGLFAHRNALRLIQESTDTEDLKPSTNP